MHSYFSEEEVFDDADESKDDKVFFKQMDERHASCAREGEDGHEHSEHDAEGDGDSDRRAFNPFILDGDMFTWAVI